MNRDERAGKGRELRGRAKQAIGRATADDRLTQEGAVDEASGRIQKTAGKARRKTGEAVERVGRSLKK